MSMATRGRRVGLKARLSTDTAPGLPFLFYRLVGRLRAIAPPLDPSIATVSFLRVRVRLGHSLGQKLVEVEIEQNLLLRQIDQLL